MSIALYRIRLRWSNGRGEARFQSIQRWLNEQPAIGVPYEEIDFAPEVGTRQIRHPHERMDDMSPRECELTMQFLRSLEP